MRGQGELFVGHAFLLLDFTVTRIGAPEATADVRGHVANIVDVSRVDLPTGSGNRKEST